MPQLFMKINSKTLLILCISLIFISARGLMPTYGASSQPSISILFTHDLHDHFYPFPIEVNGTSEFSGGFARLYSAIKEEKVLDPEALLVDAGDFSMGTLFQTIFASHSPALRLMGEMGYDVTTLGNHEFDFRAEGLAASLEAAKASGDTLPSIVASNTVFPVNDQGALTPSLEKLQKAMGAYGVKDYVIIDRAGIKIGLFGLMGKDADSNAPMAEVTFNDMVESSKRVVEVLKNQEKVDLIMALSHAGTKEKTSKSEDEMLAKKVPDIDLIISGHTHSTLEEPLIVGKTIVASAGNYGENLGIIKLSGTDGGGWELSDYRLRPIDESLKLDTAITRKVDFFKEIVQEEYLDRFNLEFDEVLAYAPFSFTPFSSLADEHREEPLGSLIADAYIYAVKKAEGDDYKEIQATMVPSGIIRDSFTQGDITTTDVFNVSSLGIGADQISGYPLISVYLTGKELKTAAEVDASIQPLMGEAQLYMSGLNYRFNPKRMIFNKVTDAYLVDPDGDRVEIIDTDLYRVVVGLYSAQMLSVVGDKSFNLLSIVPKTEEGLAITDFEAQIIYDGGQEVKEWLALAQYLQSFPRENDLSQIPLYYSEAQGRKMVDHSGNVVEIFKNPNKISLVIYLVIGLFIGLVSALAVFIIKRRKKKKLTRL